MIDQLREAAQRVIAEAASGADDHEYYQISDYAINDLRAALAGPDVCEWISVEDKLPDFNQVVLAWLVGEENHFEMLWRRHGYAFMVRHDDLNVVLNEWDRGFYDAALVKLGADYAEVTHWMPLPEPPACGRKIEVKHD